MFPFTTLYSAHIFKLFFLFGNILDFASNFAEICSRIPINDMSALISMMAWCRSGEKPLYESRIV